MPLEIPVKEVIKERNSLCLGSHKRRFAVNLLFPFPLLRPCAGGVPEQIPHPQLPHPPSLIMLPGEPSIPRVSLGREKKKQQKTNLNES